MHQHAPENQAGNYSNMSGQRTSSLAAYPLSFCLRAARLTFSFPPLHPTRHFATHSVRSRRTGKALLIGINYTGTSAELKGCHNDVDNLRDFIQGESRRSRGGGGRRAELTVTLANDGAERYGYPESGIKVLKDDGESEEPTRANMVRH